MARMSLAERNRRAIAAEGRAEELSLTETTSEGSSTDGTGAAGSTDMTDPAAPTSATATANATSPTDLTEDANPTIAKKTTLSTDATASTDATVLTSDPTSEDPTVRVGMYLTARAFEDARAAYLADWKAGGEASTLAAWVGSAIVAHAARGPEGRRALDPVSVPEPGKGITRTFAIPAEAVRHMRSALEADRDAGEWSSESAWCVRAVTAAVAVAKERGPLPVPPKRLPNKLRR